MREKQILDYIKNKTGKELNKDYYFICGTQSPFYGGKGIASATNREGFLVVKKATKEERCFTITVDNVDTYQDEIVEFLGKLSIKDRIAQW